MMARELIVAWILLNAVLIVQLRGTNNLGLFTHGLWLDETITWLISNDPSFIHAMKAIHGGVDTNPPTLYLLLWPLARVLGGLNELGLHVISFGSITLALAGLYAICRRFFEPLPSAVGAMVVAGHPSVIGQAFEARFYGPWLAATVWFAYAQMRGGDSSSRTVSIARCVLGVVAATIHWFGAIALAMIVGVDLVVHRNPTRHLVRRALPGICAAVVLLACAPFFIGQRSGLTVPTWIDPVTLGDVKRELTLMLGPMSIVFVVIASFLASLIDRTSLRPGDAADKISSRPWFYPPMRELGPLGSLLLFPIVIVIFSFLVQPALKERYILVAAAPLAPLAAWLVHRLARIALFVILAGVFTAGAAEMVGQAQSFHGKQAEWQRVLAAIDTAPDLTRPLIFKRRHELYPMLRLRPELLERSAMLDFDGQPTPDISPLAQYERDMSRKVSRFYPVLRIERIDDLYKNGRPFYVISPIQDQLELDALLGPQFTLEPRVEWLYEVTPKR